MNVIKYVCVVALSLLSMSCTGDVDELRAASAATIGTTESAIVAPFLINHGGIADHSDETVVGSIAWYFEEYGSTPGNVYQLNSNATYYISSTLEVPVSSILGEADSKTSVIRASAALDNGIMIKLNNWSLLKDLEIHGGRYAQTCILAFNKSHVKIENCTVHQTKNNYTVHSESIRPHLISLPGCDHATVTSSLLRRAGCEPKVNESSWHMTAAGVYAPNNTNLRILWNDIAYTIGAGVDFTGTVGAEIAHNNIHETGLGRIHGGGNADGVVSYHSKKGYTYLDYWITDNTIYNYYNHGIHVSGRDVHIEDNSVVTQDPGIEVTYNAIRIGDWRGVVTDTCAESGGVTCDPPFDCASNSTILRNHVHEGRGSGYTAIYVEHYKSNGVTVANNTGDGNSILWKNDVTAGPGDGYSQCE